MAGDIVFWGHCQGAKISQCPPQPSWYKWVPTNTGTSTLPSLAQYFVHCMKSSLLHTAGNFLSWLGCSIEFFFIFLHRAILPSQQTVVMVSEMIHTASLVHDDVIDSADTRRGKVSVNKIFGEKMSVLAGDYILSCASQALAKLGNSEVVELLAKVVDDLVKGE